MKTADKPSIVYARVSTRQQAASGLGIAAQIERCEAYAVAMGYVPTSVARDEGVSGGTAPADRPALGPALESLDRGEADVLIVASLSRIGRRVADVLEIADRAKRNGWSLAVLDLALDTSTPTGEFALTMLAAVAQLERRQIQDRTRAALRAAKARGKRLGGPVHERTRAAGGRALELREAGRTWRQVADTLNAEGLKAPRGGTWSHGQAVQAARSVALDREAEAAAASVAT